jgi:hypothetical protein
MVLDLLTPDIGRPDELLYRMTKILCRQEKVVRCETKDLSRATKVLSHLPRPFAG